MIVPAAAVNGGALQADWRDSEPIGCVAVLGSIGLNGKKSNFRSSRYAVWAILFIVGCAILSVSRSSNGLRVWQAIFASSSNGRAPRPMSSGVRQRGTGASTESLRHSRRRWLIAVPPPACDRGHKDGQHSEHAYYADDVARSTGNNTARA